ncbi:spore germination protein [Clostridium sp. D2Q-11]|uniref:Spore germination protein n=2 Tax=Anaeromonas frigoriresistens TaxID=2683708 RepID=A0A942V145_9FIRM|nr:spore germination protein [Anaeromonas frigoriresistens]
MRRVKFNNRILLVTYFDGLADTQNISKEVIQPLMMDDKKTNPDNYIIEEIKEKYLYSAEIGDSKYIENCIDSLVSGDTVVFVEGVSEAILVGSKGFEVRKIDTPDTETTIRGSKEGFNESLRTNITLIRRRIKNPNLVFESMKLGKQTNTEICIAYINGIVNEDILKTVKRRIKKVDVDAILESGYIEDFIQDSTFSLFPTVGNNEKPDIVASKLLEGRVAIITDGTPFVLTVPYLFIESLQTSEDYYSRSILSMIIRILRFSALLISILLPALYVAGVNFHKDFIPFELLLSISASREGIPFSPLTESILMLTAFEFLKEAGVRMPRPSGQAVSIVGALILGEAAVNAGFVSNPMIIVVALTAITSFLALPISAALPIMRLVFLLSANVVGFLGILFILLLFLIHLCSLRSFGVPYLTPISPLITKDLKDSFIKAPMWMMFTRPKSIISNQDKYYRMKINHIKKED